MNAVPLGNRLHIGLFGRRNVGKSSLLNALTGQQLAVVADLPGTTTDPVSKPMELLPLGPVVFIDTAGLDDQGEVGQRRVDKSLGILRKTDIAVLVTDASAPCDEDLGIWQLIEKRGIPCVVVKNKADLVAKREGADQRAPWVKEYRVSAQAGSGIEELKQAIIQAGLALAQDRSLVGGLIAPGDFVVLVTPIDTSAPKGRLILPQQQTIRDILEQDAIPVVAKEQELRAVFDGLNRKPSLVITDSQAFLKAAADTPKEVPLTSFSILFARQKGDLTYLAEGVKAIEALRPGDEVLIIEGCTHHTQADDLGKVKIPRWLRQIAGGEIHFAWLRGVDFPPEPSGVKLIVHCGGCMLNRREMMWRINCAKERGVPMVNYGVLIAYIQGILPRALAPFGL